MSYLDKREEVDALEDELATLPSGSIVYKTISGKRYPYLQWHEQGKTKSRYIKAAEVDRIRSDLERRSVVENRLADLQKAMPKTASTSGELSMLVLTGDELDEFSSIATGLDHRRCFHQLEDYLAGEHRGRVLILYGLRRTGKTTLMQQAILAMSHDERARCAFIQATRSNTMTDLSRDLRILKRRGFETVFVDEVTLLEDFIDGSAMLSDIFAAMGMRIVLSGTDSLGFWLSTGDALYDRSVSIHTTFIPYGEWSRLMGVDDIDEYIRYGGTFVRGVDLYSKYGTRHFESPFVDGVSTRRYIDTAIVGNIQHSLAQYRDGGRFGSLYELYEHRELTNVINRVIEDMNHRFVLRTIERTFRSSDLGSTAQLLRDARDPHERMLLADHMDEAQVTLRLRRYLDILETGERTVGITPDQLEEVRDYLVHLELIAQTNVVTLTATGRRRKEAHVVFTQPGMRYCQAKALVHSLRADDLFNGLDEYARDYVTDKILQDVRGRMLEDIVLFETDKAMGPDLEAFKLRIEGDQQRGIRGGEFDIAIRGKRENKVALFEVKHSDQMDSHQTAHLRDDSKLELVESAFGPITARAILYRGQTVINEDSVSYLNVERFLAGLEGACVQSLDQIVRPCLHQPMSNGVAEKRGKASPTA